MTRKLKMGRPRITDGIGQGGELEDPKRERTVRVAYSRERDFGYRGMVVGGEKEVRGSRMREK